jgi:hypothetical protein
MQRCKHRKLSEMTEIKYATSYQLAGQKKVEISKIWSRSLKKIPIAALV